MVKECILAELKLRKYKSFARKECNIIYNSIQEKVTISQAEFYDAISDLIEEGSLLCCNAERGGKYYAPSDELKNKLGIT